MLKEDRKNELLRLIGETGYTTVEHLAQETFLSPSTLRRNLSELEKAGLVRRSYGGVELAIDNIHTPVMLRFRKCHEQKNTIARQAASLIGDNQVIFLDASSTCLHMVPYLDGHKNLTVYTNGIELCSLLGERGIRVFCLGGLFLPDDMAFVGEYAVGMVEQLRFDALFFASSSYDGEFIMDYSESEAHLRRAVIAHSERVYYLCDSSKFGKSSSYIICRRCGVTDVITDGEKTV
ncbi:MAG: DeoR/GlpR family DNA-binding transcription regulator [Oscillospiraceae bacterium]|nr:DeoR/GlpR family DNA-binding transcription regulator [Oscillospiraceae bacterium]